MENFETWQKDNAIVPNLKQTFPCFLKTLIFLAIIRKEFFFDIMTSALKFFQKLMKFFEEHITLTLTDNFLQRKTFIKCFVLIIEVSN